VKKFFVLGILLVLVLTLTACAAGPNTMVNTAAGEGEIAGFWQGVWHGFISPFTFLISLFKDDINIYEVYNNGGWYNFGFMFGVSIIFGGGGRQSKRARKS
jgi:hypothetical protein